MRLARDIIKKAHYALNRSRIHQVAFGNIVCATRFKRLGEAGRLIETLCPLGRNKTDTLTYMLQCAETPPLPAEEEKLVEFLKKLTVRVLRFACCHFLT